MPWLVLRTGSRRGVACRGDREHAQPGSVAARDWGGKAGGGGEVGDGLEQLRLFEAVRTLLVRRSERSAVVVVVEDLHWADRATRDLISYLARTLRSGRVCWLGAIDPRSWIDTIPCACWLLSLRRLPVVEQLEVAPLGRVEVAEQLDALSGGPLPPEWVERIYRRCEGNPFYAEQLLVAGAGPARWRCRRRLASCCWFKWRPSASKPRTWCGRCRWRGMRCRMIGSPG